MSLHGSLDTFALPDVLTLLSATKKSGELRVVGGSLDGRVWLEAGNFVGADVGKATTPVDAVFELLRLKEGTFSFDGERKAPRPEAPSAVEPVLAESLSRLTEWRAIEAVVPSLDAFVTLASEPPSTTVHVADHQWRMIVAIGSGISAGALVDHLCAGEFAGCRMIKDLVDARLAAVAAVAPAPALAPVAPAEAVVVDEPAPEAALELDDADAPAVAERYEPWSADFDAPVGADEAEHDDEFEAPAEEPFVYRRGAWRSGGPDREASRDSDGGGRGGTPTPAPNTTGPSRPGSLPSRLRGAALASGAGAAQMAAAPLADGFLTEARYESIDRGTTATLAAEADEHLAGSVDAAMAAPTVDGGSHTGADAELEAAEGEEPINRGLLLKFLSSVKS